MEAWWCTNCLQVVLWLPLVVSTIVGAEWIRHGKLYRRCFSSSTAGLYKLGWCLTANMASFTLESLVFFHSSKVNIVDSLQLANGMNSSSKVHQIQTLVETATWFPCVSKSKSPDHIDLSPKFNGSNCLCDRVLALHQRRTSSVFTVCMKPTFSSPLH